MIVHFPNSPRFVTHYGQGVSRCRACRASRFGSRAVLVEWMNAHHCNGAPRRSREAPDVLGGTTATGIPLVLAEARARDRRARGEEP